MPIIGNPIYQSAFVVDQFSGNGSTVAFTMSVAPAGVTNVLVAVSGVLQDPSTYGVVGNTITFSAAPPSGTGNISCRYLGVPVTGVTTTAYRTVTEFTATASQTTFTPPSYTPNFINVYLNGVLLGSADYTASNGTTVVLATGASAGNLVTVESFLVSSVLNAIPNTAGSVSSANIANDVTINFADGSASTPSITNNGDTNTGIFFPAADTIAFAEGGAESARFNSSGNLGVGTTTPSARLHAQAATVSADILFATNSNNRGLNVNTNASDNLQISHTNSNYNIDYWVSGTGVHTFSTAGAERMRIDSAGRVQIGTTATSPAPSDTYGIVLGVDGAGGAYAGASQFSTNGTAAIVLNRGGDNGTTMLFRRSGTSVGAINVTTSSTAYVTSSDYRLKENIAPMTGALAKVSQLKPCTYTWKADGSDGQGFIAHELAEVCPDAVTGEKDGEQMQGVDTSFLVATLTAAIQELKTELDSVKAELATLKGAE